MRAGHAPVAAPAAARPALVALGGGNGNGHAAPAPAPAGAWPTPLGIPAPMSTATVSAASHTPGDDTPSTWSTRWPLLVAALAIIAIVASVAMLLFGGNNDEKKGSKAKRFNGPAPELMPTDPGAHQVAPGAGRIDPNAPGDPALPTPTIPDPAPAPPPAPSPSAHVPRDIEDFMSQSATALCERVTSCGGFDETVTTLCQMAPSMIPQMADQLEAMCPDFDGVAARECVDSLSRFPCPSGSSGTDMMAMQNALMGLSGCQRVCPQAYRGWTPPDPDDTDDL